MLRSLELKIPPVVVSAAVAAVMLGAARLVPSGGFRWPFASVVAIGLVAAGIAVAVAGVVSFRRAKTTVNPLQPAGASSLVATGIYRRSRNPMYLGMLLVLLGLGVALGNALSLALALLFVPLMNWLQIGPEEKILAALFGAEYLAYRTQVRRWL